MTNMGGEQIGLWDDQDAFYYDVLSMPNGVALPMRLRSMVGLIPLFAVEVLEGDHLERWPGFQARLEWLLDHRPELAALVSRWDGSPAEQKRRLLSLARAYRMKKILARMLDPKRVPLGLRRARAVSRVPRASATFSSGVAGATR